MIERMIGEIESYLSAPLRDADSPCEQEERRLLGEILAQLKAEKLTGV